MSDDRSDEVLRHQDQAGQAGSPLGVFVDEQLLATLSNDQESEPIRSAVLEQLAAQHAVDRLRLEVLLVCHRHPGVAAVDCLACVPLEDL